VHLVRGVQLQLAALEPAANGGGLDHNGVRPGLAVSADRQTDRDATRDVPGGLRHNDGVYPDHRALHVSRNILQYDASNALQERARTQGSLQAYRRTSLARRTDRL